MQEPDADRLLALVREATFTGPDTPRWVALLGPQREQLIEAGRFLATSGRDQDAVELAASGWRLWNVTGDVVGGRRFIAAALSGGSPTQSRGRALALYGDGWFAFRAGAQQESQQCNQEALEIARALGDRQAEALALVGLSRVALRDGDYKRVRSLSAQALELTRELDPAASASPRHLLAAGTRLDGDYQEAARLYGENLELSRRLEDGQMIGMELYNLGHVELHRGNIDAADRCFTESASHSDQRLPYDMAMTQLKDSALAFARGDRKTAAEFLGRARSSLDAAGIALDPDDAFEVTWLQDRLAAEFSPLPD